MPRFLLLTTLAMVAFAANSVLNRTALLGEGSGPASFAALRIMSGAAMLWVLVSIRERGLARASLNIFGASSLALYVLGFSFAYVSLDTGVGALILFGGVQIVMFLGAVLSKEPLPVQRWIGAVLAFAGLAWLMWPGAADAPDVLGATLMAAAALGWGIYSLLGRKSADPLKATCANFVWAIPAGVGIYLLVPDGMTAFGAFLAIVSGAVTSGLGYALWYSVLPQLGAARGALAQLTVPIIAVVGGVIFLGEDVTGRFLLSTTLVLGGVAFGLWSPRSKDT